MAEATLVVDARLAKSLRALSEDGKPLQLFLPASAVSAASGRNDYKPPKDIAEKWLEKVCPPPPEQRVSLGGFLLQHGVKFESADAFLGAVALARPSPKEAATLALGMLAAPEVMLDLMLRAVQVSCPEDAQTIFRTAAALLPDDAATVVCAVATRFVGVAREHSAIAKVGKKIARQKVGATDSDEASATDSDGASATDSDEDRGTAAEALAEAGMREMAIEAQYGIVCQPNLPRGTVHVTDDKGALAAKITIMGRPDGLKDDGEMLEIKTRMNRFRGVPKEEKCQLEVYLWLASADANIKSNQILHVEQYQGTARETLYMRKPAVWKRIVQGLTASLQALVDMV